MRFLADENFPGGSVKSLKMEGHSVFWARVDSPGEKDGVLLRRARLEKRILLTFDKDFGELAFQAGLPAEAGIILFRLASPSPQQLHDRILTALHEKIDWAGHFAVVEEKRIRLTPLPSNSQIEEKSSDGDARETPAVYLERKPKPPGNKRTVLRRRSGHGKHADVGKKRK